MVGVSLWQRACPIGHAGSWCGALALGKARSDQLQRDRSGTSCNGASGRSAPSSKLSRSALLSPTIASIISAGGLGRLSCYRITRDGVAQLWNPFTRRMLRLFQKDDAFITSAAFDLSR